MGSERHDTYILKKREEKKKAEHIQIDEGIYVEGEILYFERCDIEETFSIMLPTSFKDMPEKLAMIKYPSAFRPQYILTTADLSVNMAFNIFPDQLESKDLEAVSKRIMQTLLIQNPNYIFSDFMKNEQGYWFEFRSRALDHDVFNMMLITKLDKRILHISFNCPYERHEEWKPTVLKMWQTIEEE